MRKTLILFFYLIFANNLWAKDLYLKAIIRPFEDLVLNGSSTEQEFNIYDKSDEICIIKKCEDSFVFSFLDYKKNYLQIAEKKIQYESGCSNFIYKGFNDGRYVFWEEDIIYYDPNSFDSKRNYLESSVDVSNNKITEKDICSFKTTNELKKSKNVLLHDFVLEKADSWGLNADESVLGYYLLSYKGKIIPNIYLRSFDYYNENEPYYGVIEENEDYLIISANILQEDVFLDNLALIKEPYQKEWKSRRNDFDYVCLIYSKKEPPENDKIALYTFCDSNYKTRRCPYSKDEFTNRNMNLTTDSTFGEIIELSGISLYSEPDFTSERKFFRKEQYPTHGVVLSFFTDENGNVWKKMMDDEAEVCYIPAK